MFQQDDSLKHGFNHSFQFKVRPRLQLSIVMSFPATSRYELLTKSSALTAFLRLSLLLYCYSGKKLMVPRYIFCL
jgi:hypothetical protein